MTKKLVVFILIFALGFSLPFYTSQGAAAIAYITKEFGLDLVARALASKLLKSLSDGIVNSINNLGIDGRKKAPTFVQNWKKFLANAQDIGENQFRSQLNYVVKRGVLCNDLQSPLVLAFQAGNVPYIDIGEKEKYDELKQNTLLPYQTKIKCTVPDKTREEFKKDFEKGGGWNTWSKMVEPQNNLAGTLGLSLEELHKQRLSQQGARRSEVTAGGGFTGVQDSCRGIGKTAECSFLGKTLTPAKVLGEGAAGWLDNHGKWLVTSDELSEVLISILNAAINKLTNFATKGVVTDITQKAPDFLKGAKKDCFDQCLESHDNSCRRLNLLPPNDQQCYDDGEAACNQQCSDNN